MDSKFHTTSVPEIKPEDRDYKKYEDWVNLFREAGILKQQLDQEHYAGDEFVFGTMKGPTILTTLSHSPLETRYNQETEKWEPGPPRYEVKKICMMPPGVEGPTHEEWKQIYEAYLIDIPERHR